MYKQHYSISCNFAYPSLITLSYLLSSFIYFCWQGQSDENLLE